MNYSKIIFGMVCSLLIIFSLFSSGCVETVETAEEKKIVQRVGKLVLVEPDANEISTFYVCIIDQDGVFYYPTELNKKFVEWREFVVNELHKNNLSDLPILFSAERLKNAEIGDKIGRPVRLSYLEVIAPVPTRDAAEIYALLESSIAG
jgi:hypothetical protein